MQLIQSNEFRSNGKGEKEYCHCHKDTVRLFIDVLEFVTWSTDPESVLPDKQHGMLSGVSGTPPAGRPSDLQPSAAL